MRVLTVFMCAMALSACASTESQTPVATLQNSVYIAGDQSAPVQPMEILAASAESESKDSALKRLYWFLGGR